MTYPDNSAALSNCERQYLDPDFYMPGEWDEVFFEIGEAANDNGMTPDELREAWKLGLETWLEKQENEDMPTNHEIASSWALWKEYVDPDATMTEEEFDALPEDERLAMIDACFGDDGSDEEASQ